MWRCPGPVSHTGHVQGLLTNGVLGLDGGSDFRRVAQAMLVCRQHSEHVRLPLGKVEDGIPGGPHSHLGIHPLPAAAPHHGLRRQGLRWGPHSLNPHPRGCSALAPRLYGGRPQPMAPRSPSTPLFWILKKEANLEKRVRNYPKLDMLSYPIFMWKPMNDEKLQEINTQAAALGKVKWTVNRDNWGVDAENSIITSHMSV